MASPRVLVGIVTYDGHRYALERLLLSLKAMTYAAFDVLFIDNSEHEEYSAHLKNLGFEVLRTSSEGHRVERVILGRELLRTAALERGYDYLFFIDSDVICLADTLERLLQWKKDVVSGMYLLVKRREGKLHVIPSVFVAENGAMRTTTVYEMREARLIPIAAAGLGCCLISAAVLKRLHFRNIGQSTSGGEDFSFFHDVIALGVTPYVDTAVKCFHMCVPHGDERSELYKWENHELGAKYGA